MGSKLSLHSSNDPAAIPNLLQVKGLCKKYYRGGLWRKRVRVDAISEVDFEIAAGQTLGLVGESGSGKSTVARCVTRLERPDSGQILIQGIDVANLPTMNPGFSVLQAIEEPLLIQEKTSHIGNNRGARRDLVSTLMKEVGLSADWMNRSILHFSGGQCQRIALARALALRPRLLVLDEALSGLDLSTQAQIANLLQDLQVAHGLTYLLISHDLALTAWLADAIAVMSGGRIVEVGPTQQIVSTPNHAATKQLLASAQSAASNLSAITGAPA